MSKLLALLSLLILVFVVQAHKVAPVENKVYLEECSACHFAYPPSLLPERSWQKMLNAKSLENHFGENAELDAETLLTISNYAFHNSADKSYSKISRKINRSIPADEAPLRITKTEFYLDKHEDLTPKQVENNPQVKSYSNCNKCHQGAEKGIFDEDDVDIPGFPNWHD